VRQLAARKGRNRFVADGVRALQTEFEAAPHFF
jgi:hypothetical protein